MEDGMKEITQHIETLSAFQGIHEISYVIESLLKLELDMNSDEKEASHKEEIELLRVLLLEILHSDNFVANNKISEAVYDTLLTLAQLSPLNTDDLFTYEEITEADRIFISTGHQFSLKTLIEYHNQRDFRTDLGETLWSKYLLNPYLNLKFDKRDIQQITMLAAIKGIEINNLKPLSPVDTFYVYSFLDNVKNLFSKLSFFAAGNAPIYPDELALSLKPYHYNLQNSRSLGYWEYRILDELSGTDLTAETLVSHYKSRYDFSEEHFDALCDLLKNRKYSLDNALMELEGLSPIQVRGISKGLCRDDVSGLENSWHVTALIHLKTHGLTAEMLLDRYGHGQDFNKKHVRALCKLIKNEYYSLEDALLKIDENSSTPASLGKQDEQIPGTTFNL